MESDLLNWRLVSCQYPPATGEPIVLKEALAESRRRRLRQEWVERGHSSSKPREATYCIIAFVFLGRRYERNVVLEKLQTAMAKMQDALDLLDSVGAPADVGAHLDLAISRIGEIICPSDHGASDVIAVVVK